MIMCILIWINNNLATLLVGIAASVFAYRQNQINNRQVKINLGLKYQEHFIRIQNLLLSIEYCFYKMSLRGC